MAAHLDEREEEESWRAPRDSLRPLPCPRPRSLTPQGFRDASSPGPAAPKAQFQESASYFKLPPSVRRDILLLAFGRRRLHMQLFYSHPDATPPQGLVHANHCGIDHVESVQYRDRRARLVDKSQPKAWRWWSSECHRLAPNEPTGPMTSGGLAGPWADYCRIGLACHCLEYRDRDAPSMCHVGILGWLLSCRQNYAEGIDVLYATNTLSMCGPALVTRLPDVLLPQRLAAITSLEISWPLTTVPIEDALDPNEVDEEYLDDVFKVLSSRFPVLRRLYLSLELSAGFSPRLYAEEAYVESIVAHIDPFVRQISSRLEECAIALPGLLFDIIYDDAMREDRGRYRDKGQRNDSYRQVWRSIDGAMTRVRLPYVNSYPGPPFHWAQADDAQVAGCWLLEGSELYIPPSPPQTASCLPRLESPLGPYGSDGE